MSSYMRAKLSKLPSLLRSPGIFVLSQQFQLGSPGWSGFQNNFELLQNLYSRDFLAQFVQKFYDGTNKTSYAVFFWYDYKQIRTLFVKIYQRQHKVTDPI